MRPVPDRDSETTTEMFRRIHANRHLFSLEANLEALRLARERAGMTAITDDYKPYRAGEVEWVYPHEQEPPTGVALHILQLGGIAIRGQWAYGCGFVAWQYQFKRNKTKEAEFFTWMKDKGTKV
jgi:hypothetical protein